MPSKALLTMQHAESGVFVVEHTVAQPNLAQPVRMAEQSNHQAAACAQDITKQHIAHSMDAMMDGSCIRSSMHKVLHRQSIARFCTSCMHLSLAKP